MRAAADAEALQLVPTLPAGGAHAGALQPQPQPQQLPFGLSTPTGGLPVVDEQTVATPPSAPGSGKRVRRFTENGLWNFLCRLKDSAKSITKQ